MGSLEHRFDGGDQAWDAGVVEGGDVDAAGADDVNAVLDAYLFDLLAVEPEQGEHAALVLDVIEAGIVDVPVELISEGAANAMDASSNIIELVAPKVD